MSVQIKGTALILHIKASLQVLLSTTACKKSHIFISVSGSWLGAAFAAAVTESPAKLLEVKLNCG